MTQLLDEPRSAGHRAEKGITPPDAGPGRIERPTHPAMPRLRTRRLRFAPAPPEDAADPAPRPRRRDRTDWVERAFEAGWVGLMAACVAECACRLLWAVQP